MNDTVDPGTTGVLLLMIGMSCLSVGLIAGYLLRGAIG